MGESWHKFPHSAIWEVSSLITQNVNLISKEELEWQKQSSEKMKLSSEAISHLKTEECTWSTALYASETWTLGKESERRVEAFEIWCWRKMTKWTGHSKNEDVLMKVNE